MKLPIIVKIPALTTLGGRKFIVSLTGLQMAATLLFLDKIDPMVFRDICLGIIGMFVGANTTQAVMTKGRTDRSVVSPSD